MASGTWFGETSRQSQAKLVKQQHTGISPSHIPEAVPYCPHIMNVILLRGRCSTYKSDQARAMVSHARGPEFDSASGLHPHVGVKPVMSYTSDRDPWLGWGIYKPCNPSVWEAELSHWRCMCTLPAVGPRCTLE